MVAVGKVRAARDGSAQSGAPLARAAPPARGAPRETRRADPGCGDEPLRVELDLDAGALPRVAVWLRFAARLALELCLCRPQRGAAPRARPQLLRQLIAARLPIELILAAVCLRRLGEDRAGDLRVAAIGLARGARRDLRAIDRDHPDRQPAPPACRARARP